MFYECDKQIKINVFPKIFLFISLFKELEILELQNNSHLSLYSERYYKFFLKQDTVS